MHKIFFFFKFWRKKIIGKVLYFYANILQKSYENPLKLADPTADGRLAEKVTVKFKQSLLTLCSRTTS